MTAQLPILVSVGGAAIETASCLWLELVMFAVAATGYALYTNGGMATLQGGGVAAKPGREEFVSEFPGRVSPGGRHRPAPRSSAASRKSAAGGEGGSSVQGTIAAIRARGRAGDLQGAVGAFDALQGSGTSPSPQIHNCLLDAYFQCKDLPGALKHFKEMSATGTADVVSYNTVLKALLGLGRTGEAQELLHKMAACGVPASRITFHELLHAKVLADDHRGMWQVLEDMRVAGHASDAVTCSILVKSLKNGAYPWAIERVMTVVAEIGGVVDEVLLSSVAEACIRIQRLDLLSDVMRRLEKDGRALALTAPGYGSLIKAHGQARDVSRMWELWREMRNHSVKATDVTLGCMVDALVMNGRVDEALELVHEIHNDAESRSIVNTVVYSTILKGFAKGQQIERVFTVYAEMAKHGILPNVISYNTIMDACARCGAMSRVGALLKDMRTGGVVPDLVTYSTLVKGYSLAGDVTRGFKVLEEMKSSGVMPDEIMYNSLLDGCAKEHRVNEALQVLEDMQHAGIAPSNHTLSILVKLLGRTKRLEEAFKKVEELSAHHGIRPNVQVYTCLIQACLNNRRLDRAMAAHDMMAAEPNCQPDEFAYSVLVRGCLQAKDLDKAVYAVRSAYQLPSSDAAPASPARRSRRVAGVEVSLLAEVVAKLRAGSTKHQEAVRILASDLEEKQGINIDKMPSSAVPKVTRRGPAGGRRA